jgi:hypothetical protein
VNSEQDAISVFQPTTRSKQRLAGDRAARHERLQHPFAPQRPRDGPYYYSGLAQTLDQVLDGSQDGNGGVRHHVVTRAADRANLVAFLRSIDQTTPIFP